MTIRGTVETELEISRSRFITNLKRVVSEEEARDEIARVKGVHPKARHHCSAFVIGPTGQIQRSNDDGEPSGTAGAPMLDALTSAGLSDVVAVVTRYFGGILLGAGGLTRAYRSAVAQATLEATKVTRALRREVFVTASYQVAPLIEAEARRFEMTVAETQYLEAVTITLAVANSQIETIESFVAQLSSGEAEISFGDEKYVDL